MTPTFIAKLGLRPRPTNVGIQKIDGLPLETYSMTSAMFLVWDSLERVGFFEKTFLLANTNIELVLKMPFLSLSNANVKFTELKKLTWRFYDTAEALLTTS